MRNSVPLTIIGNLGGDPELRFTPSGAAVVRFSVGVNPRFYDKTAGEWKDAEPSFYSVTAWRTLAENIAESLHKGDRVVVAGTLAQRRWKNDQDEPRTSWDLTAEAVGPDLTYAQATVRKMARTARGETPPDDPWATGSREPVPAGAGLPGDDEPPF